MNLEVSAPIGSIFDTHAHYDDLRFEKIRNEILRELPLAGVCGIINCGINEQSSLACIAIAEQFDYCYAAVGYHPEDIKTDEITLRGIENACSHEKVVAIGEIGLDYHWDTPPERQKAWFKAQLELANRLSMPVIVHDREAHGDTLDILCEYTPKGVLHCFSGSVEMARKLLSIGMYIGVGGVVTFGNARKLVEVVNVLPMDRILLETDAPYLAPEPYRGQLCHSAHIALTAAKIAEIKGISVTEVFTVCKKNAESLFFGKSSE